MQEVDIVLTLGNNEASSHSRFSTHPVDVAVAVAQ